MAQSIGDYLIRAARRERRRPRLRRSRRLCADLLQAARERARSPWSTPADEQGAGFAADAYARLRGLGVACITYCVGGLKVANAAAQAYAERSPVVVISGAPGTQESASATRCSTTRSAISTPSCASSSSSPSPRAVLDDPATAAGEIDRVAGARRAATAARSISRCPRDMAVAEIVAGRQRTLARRRPSDAGGARRGRRRGGPSASPRAEHPVILAGEELHRFGLQERARRRSSQQDRHPGRRHHHRQVGLPGIGPRLSRRLRGRDGPR